MIVPVSAPVVGDVPCVIDHLHRDLAVAEDARRGTFTHAGVRLFLGRTPDWIEDGLPGDEEWRIEWVKLYEGLDLAHAYGVTGDPDLLAAWEDLVAAFCDQVPVGHDTSDVSARRVQNWLYAWQRFRSAAGFRGLRPGLAEVLTNRIARDCAHLEDHLTPERNHRTLECYTLLLAGIALGDRARAARALALLADNARADILEDGVQRELSTDYHCIVLRSLLGAVWCARREGLDVPPALLTATERACDFALHVQLPDGTTPALSDGDVGDFRALLALGARLLDRPELAWAASCGREGSPPVRTAVTFPVSGYVVQRSGWGTGPADFARQRVAVLDAGPLGDGGHGHYDQLSVVLADGRALVTDPGRYTYADDAEGWRRWFKGTAAHNTVCVDDLDQVPYRRGKPKGALPAARILGRMTEPGLDLVSARAESPCHDAAHTRTLAFVGRAFWVVHDRLRAATPHRYEARWHLAHDVPMRRVVRHPGGGAEVSADGLRITVPAGFGEVVIEDGWVSPRYGEKFPAPVVTVAAAGQADADLITVLVPGTGPVEATARLTADGVEVVAGAAGGRWTLRWDPERPEHADLEMGPW